MCGKDIANKLNGKDKDSAEAGLKRKTSLIGPQRIPLGPSATRTRTSVIRPQRMSLLPTKRTSRSTSQEPASTLIIPVDEEEEDKGDGMEVEQPEEFDEPEAETSLIIGEQEVEAMVGLDDSEAEEAETEDTAKVAAASKPPRIWPEVSTDRAARYRREVDAIREVFEDEVDMYDTTMVSEYAEDIFDYMGGLEVGCLAWYRLLNCA
jgi:G2/mitotic-specific cyclin 2